MLVADALRLGGAILTQYPDLVNPLNRLNDLINETVAVWLIKLAAQLVGRLLPEAGANLNVRRLLEQCDKEGITHCALMPTAHCLHTPGGPLKVLLSHFTYPILLATVDWFARSTRWKATSLPFLECA